MTVYVDDFRVPAKVGRVSGRWSHLTADDVEELHTFAARLGLRRAWFQARCKHSGCQPCPHWHYDVTDTMRRKAIAQGAAPVTLCRMGELFSARHHT